MALKSIGRQIAIEVLLAVLIGALLGLLGPFDTYRMAAGPRMAYWIVMIVTGLMIFRPTILVSDWFGDAAGLPGWAARLLAIAIGSLPMTLLVAWLFSGFDLAQALRRPDLALFYGNVFLISALTNALFHFAFRGRSVAPVAQALISGSENEVGVRTTFQNRLPPGFGPLIALSSEDHYVRAHSATSSTLILIRLRDAIAELDPAVEGMQVHRSWWVARSAVSGSKNADRALRLVLTNGLEVPVSRDRIAGLKAGGWA